MFTLQEALEAIKDKPEFRVSERDGYTVIDYLIQTKDTFKGETDRQTLILQNLRGTAFSQETGKIISLPFHKFHNLGECEGYLLEDIDFSKKESVMLKLDGSMIRVIPKGDSWAFGTRAGETDVSEIVQRWFLNADAGVELCENLYGFIMTMLDNNFTPIFEFTSRTNKVVIDYPEPELTLLAVRHNSTGVYATREQIEYYQEKFNIPVVGTFDEFTPENVKEWKDAEGVVVSFSDGFRVKIKADDYVMKHRTKDLMRFEKDVVKLCLDGSVDDVLPLLDKEDKDRLSNYFQKLVTGIYRVQIGQELFILSNTVHNAATKVTKKEFAEMIKDRKDTKYLFQLFDGKESNLKEDLLASCGSGTRVGEFLNRFDLPRWNNV